MNRLISLQVDPRSSQYFLLFDYVRTITQKQEAHSCEKHTFFMRGLGVGGFPGPPFLMYTVLYVTRVFKDSWRSSFYKTETLRCFMRPPPLHTQPCLCPIHWCGLASHLYVFCHTLEEFSICSTRGFAVVSLQEKNGRKGSFSARLPFFTQTRSIGWYMRTMSRHCAVADKDPSQTVEEFK